ncbi:MAG: flagellar biosynthetic protein FliQ [Flavobacteriaceae bacterium]|jgi:flagellar biosynthetic protein FliQ|nr:flagellar biosynthetic protein FliQ [Flavobacteriaceae bacterium]
MAFDQNVQYLSLAFWQIIMTAGPILAVALGIGLFIGLIQAATSIQEMTLSFVPKLFVVLGALALLAPYTLNELTDYFSYIFDEIARKGL